jgi:hypothetical protein
VFSASAEERFARPVLKVSDPKAYQFTRLDDVSYPSLGNDRYSVSCIVFRGTERYYVEVRVTNKTSEPLKLFMGFISFDKPGYTVYGSDPMIAAREAASFAGERFVAVPPPYVPPTYNTTVNATATTYGNQTYVSGTATTTPDYSGQAGANLGNAVGNAIAAHKFHKMQHADAALATFIATHVQTMFDSPLQAGETRTIITTFQQPKAKKKPFDVTLTVGADTFKFSYKE